MNKIDRASVLLLTILGFSQLILTPFFYNSFSQEAVWFFGAGLSLVFLGFLNLARRLAPHSGVVMMSAIANTIGVLFVMSIVAVYTAPQSVIALFLMVSITMATIEQLTAGEKTRQKSSI
jgi:hypothetical protein